MGKSKAVAQGEILKSNDEQRMVWGWASVISENGKPVVDTQGDVIYPDEMVKATNAFMESVRAAKAMHEGGKIGEVIHSLPLTEELANSLGIVADREGWLVGVRIRDDDVWEGIKSGKYKAFSIGGMAEREDYEEEDSEEY
jgi:hypothetical protein